MTKFRRSKTAIVPMIITQPPALFRVRRRIKVGHHEWDGYSLEVEVGVALFRDAFVNEERENDKGEL